MKPWWRWRLFCIGLWLHFNAPRPLDRVGSWLVGAAPLAEWLGDVDDGAEFIGEESF